MALAVALAEADALAEAMAPFGCVTGPSTEPPQASSSAAKQTGAHVRQRCVRWLLTLLNEVKVLGRARLVIDDRPRLFIAMDRQQVELGQDHRMGLHQREQLTGR